jgi:hypothetical protein
MMPVTIAHIYNCLDISNNLRILSTLEENGLYVSPTIDEHQQPSYRNLFTG